MRKILALAVTAGVASALFPNLGRDSHGTVPEMGWAGIAFTAGGMILLFACFCLCFKYCCRDENTSERIQNNTQRFLAPSQETATPQPTTAIVTIDSAITQGLL